MQHGIREFRPRQPLDRQLDANTLNRILRELESLRITRVVNGTFKKLPGGTEIVVAPQRGGGGSGAEPHPFKIFSSKNPNNANQYIVTVYPGTLNNLLPTNLFDGAGLRQFIISADELNYVILEANTNGSDQFLSCEIAVESSPPAAQDPTKFSLPTAPQFLLGVVYNASAYNTINDSLTLTGKQQFTTDKQPPAPAGQLPYEIWYVWG